MVGSHLQKYCFTDETEEEGEGEQEEFLILEI